MSIVVKDKRGFQVLHIEDESLLVEVQEMYLSPPYFIEVGTGTAGGPLAAEFRIHLAMFLKRLMRKRAAGLMQAIKDAPDQAAVKIAVRGMFKLMMDIIEILE